ncbi:MAG: dethiobiotin synthase [Bacteriovoracaceae bacterium]|nr:dethiobiotin synthase [Bacteriovoracaceae bacterium]
MNNFFVTGTDTNVGKTICSFLLVARTKKNYWKPIQCGDIDESDSQFIRKFSDIDQVIIPEHIKLNTPQSPNIAATLEDQIIKVEDLPKNEEISNTIIEGAGGILVPINNHEYVIDIAYRYNAEIILVTRDYLGCINHTLMSINYLKTNKHKLKGIIFSGKFNKKVRDTIKSLSGVSNFLEIPELENLSSNSSDFVTSELGGRIDHFLNN